MTWPKHRFKMCSRVAASVAHATGFGHEMIVSSLKEYEERAVWFGDNLHPGQQDERNPLVSLRKNLFMNRDHMPLFDTRRWTGNLEKGYKEAWERWANGSEGSNRKSGNIFIHDDEPVIVRSFDT